MIKQTLKICIGIWLILCFFFLLAGNSFASLNVPLTVSDYAGTTRTNEPVTSGVPLPESVNIFSINQLQLADSSGNTVPAQFTVTSRWRGTPDDNSKPIKWVLLDFQADVPADGTSVYYLKNGDIGNRKNTNLSLQQDDNKITISTGKAKFEINKNYFNLFDYVHIDKGNDGQLNDLIVSSANDSGVVLTGTDGTKYYTTLEAPEEIEIEEQGPMRTVVKIRGVFKAEDGSYFAPSIYNSADATKANLDKLGYAYNSRFGENKFSQPYKNSIIYYNCRIHFYNNKEYVKIFFTLENNGANGRTSPEPYFAPDQTVYFDSVNLILKTSNTSQINVLSEDSSAQLASADNFTLYQDWKENLVGWPDDTLERFYEKGIYYVTKKNAQQLSTGMTNPGWVDANSDSQGVGLAIRHFWQNFPKKITVNNSEIKIGFWPKEGYYPYTTSAKSSGSYLFDAGRHKTYEMLLRFYTGSQDSQTKDISKSLESPLMALAPSEWYAQTNALGMIAPSGLTSSDSEVNEAMERFDKLQTAMVYAEDSENGLTITNIKTKEDPHWEFELQNRFFSWMNFGDLLWGGSSPCALHYDWTYKMLLHYIRTGKRNLFDAGVEMAKHRYDIDQYHGERIKIGGSSYKYNNHMAFYESSGHADPNLQSYHPSKTSIPTHTWNGGLVLYYCLTGDKKALETAEEVGKGMLNYYGNGGLRDANNLGCASDETRYEGWSMVNLINLYRATGKSVYLETAKNIAKNRILYKEQQVGGGRIGADKNAAYVKTALSNAGRDCIESGCNTCKNVMRSLMLAYISEGLIDVQYETKDEELGNLIVRMADLLKDEMLFGGDYNENGQYRPIQTSAKWVEGQLNPSGELPYTLFWINYFARAYQLTNNSEYLELARKCFRDIMFYYTKKGYINPNVRSKISFIEGGFPNSHTKIHGWIGRTSQVYLNTEWQLQQGDLQIITTSLPKGTVGQDYSYPVSIAGGTSPYTWTYSDLPSWLTVNPVNETTREISGIPLQAASFTFTIQFEDSAGTSVAKQFALKVNEQTELLTITTQTLPEATVGVPYTATLYASGGSQHYTWFVDPTALAGGLYLNGDTILGTPDEAGTYSLTITVSDGSQEVVGELSITVNPADSAISDIEVYGTNHDFGFTEIGNSADWKFIIFNKGTAVLTVNSISSDNQIFSIVSPYFPKEMSPGQTLNVLVAFTPVAEGEAIGRLVINSNDPDEGEIMFSMSGTGERSDNEDPNNPTLVTVTFRDEILDTTLDGYTDTRKEMNFGGAGNLNIWSNGVRKILLKSNLSQIPADAVIEKAELKLYCYLLRWPSSDPRLEAYRIACNWEEGEGTWGEARSGVTWYEYDYYDHDLTKTNDWNIPGGDIDTFTDFGGTGGLVAETFMQENSWITFDISGIVQKWVSGKIENHGLLFQAINRGYNDARFYSSEYADESLRPALVVSYSVKPVDTFDISTSELHEGEQDTYYEAFVSATNGALPYQWSVEGLPAGLDWRCADDATIVVYGTPTVNGQFSVKVTVEDKYGQMEVKDFILSITDNDSQTPPITVTFRDEISDTTLDGYADARKETNFGGASSLNIWSNGVRKILLRSDLSQIPADAVIEKAELKLYCYSLRWPSSDPRLEAYRIACNWEEGEGTWGEARSGVTWYEYDYYDHDLTETNDWKITGGDIDTDTDFGYAPNGLVAEAVMQENAWITFDISSIVQKWISGEIENHGVLFQAINRGYNDAKFYSSEYADESLRPVLMIECSY